MVQHHFPLIGAESTFFSVPPVMYKKTMRETTGIRAGVSHATRNPELDNTNKNSRFDPGFFAAASHRDHT